MAYIFIVSINATYGYVVCIDLMYSSPSPQDLKLENVMLNRPGPKCWGASVQGCWNTHEV